MSIQKLDLPYLIQVGDSHNIWSSERTINRSDYLKQGVGIETRVFKIVSGSFRIFAVIDEQEYTIRFGYEGELIMALDSFLTNQSSNLEIQALRKSKVQSCTKEDFMDLIYGSEDMLRTWTKVQSHLIHQQMERELDLHLSTPESRYQRVLCRSPRLFQEVPHKYIASYLRMTPETLSRLQKS